MTQQNNVTYHYKRNFNLEKVVSPGVSCGGRSTATGPWPSAQGRPVSVPPEPELGSHRQQ